MILKTNYYNVNVKNSKPRIYIESKDLELSGFKSGVEYFPIYSDGKIELFKNEIDALSGNGLLNKKRKVSIQKDSQAPVLDFCNTKIKGFDIGNKARVEYSTNTITITNERN